MKRVFSFCFILILGIASIAQEKLQYHLIKKDNNGKIVPWYNSDPGIAYDHVLNLVWNFWDTMRTDMNGLPYYMNHQVWRPGANDPRGIGGDQIAMALSSWRLYYQYTGNERVKENMKFMAEYYLTQGLSPETAEWPDIPFPYNTLIYSGIYDGDMILGRNFTQPDKAGSFGIELIHLYKMLNAELYPNQSDKLYLEAAIKIANTLASHTKVGDSLNSPLPFKVNAVSGEIGILKQYQPSKETDQLSGYTTNWAGTMELFLELQKLGKGDTSAYKNAFDRLLEWMKVYPLKNNRWGPFFEDIPGWSDTQINAISFAQFIMNHKNLFPNWRAEVRGIFEWVYKFLGNESWKQYGVIAVNEQTAYRVPGNSHTSRQASAQLQYITLSGDDADFDQSVRQLNWATYMVDRDGKNRYMQDENWLTDGYGDFMRHYLRSMGDAPELAPADQDHLISSSSVVQHIFYQGMMNKYYYPMAKDTNDILLHYRVYDADGIEKLRLTQKPSGVLINDKPVGETLNDHGYEWKSFKQGGLLTIRRSNGHTVTILK